MADTNAAAQSPVDTIVQGIQQIAAPLEQSEKENSKLESEAKAASSEAETAVEKEKSASQQYAQAIQNLKSARNAISDDLKAAEKTERDANAENKVAEMVSQGAVVGVGDVLKLMEEEEEAKDARKDAESDLFKVTVEGAGQVFSSAAGVVAEGLKDTLTGIDHSFGTKGVAALVGGAVAGTVLGGGPTVSDLTSKLVGNYVALKTENAVGDGVEEKTVDGLENEDAYQAYVQANVNGEPEDPYLAQNGGQGEAETKSLPAAPEGYVPPTTSGGPADPNDALTTDDFSDLTDPDKIMAENAAIAAQQAQERDVPEGGLLEKVAQTDIVQAVVKTVADEVAPVEPEIPEPEEDFDSYEYTPG